MVNLTKGNYSRALGILQAAREQLAKTSPEYAHALHCTGRVYVSKGEKTSNEARRFFREAAVLYRAGPHELENLIWRLKVEMLLIRLTLVPRGLWLSWKARDARQCCLVLTLGLSRWITLHITA
jgi:hypothetical protein